MNGFWIMVCSAMLYDMVKQERKLAYKHAVKYQKQKSKVSYLKNKLNRSKNTSK